MRYTPFRIILITTLLTTLASFLLVYTTVFMILGTVKTTYIVLSVLMPLLLTPAVLSVIFRLVTRLDYYKEALEKQVAENREKDLLLFEQERFVLMGEMLSNIAHQWRQPLNTINLTLLSTRLANASKQLDNRQLEEVFDRIEDNVHYLSNTIDDFRSFFQNKDPQNLSELSKIIREVDTVMTPTLKAHKITFDIDRDNALDHRLKVSSALSQVLLNLVSNAKDALGGSEQRSKSIRMSFQHAPDALIITVEDNGPGIPDAIRPKIFDAYYTTKGPNHGTGIGLHMSRQIIEKVFHGTLALVEADRGKTCFSMIIPHSEQCRSRE